MRDLGRLFFALAFVFTGWAPATALAQTAVILVRHAEKVDESKTSLLSEKGHARAADLARHLRDAGVRAIFTSEVVRTQETAAPLAKALGVVPVAVPAKEVERLVAEVKKHAGEVVLVVSHADLLPKIIAALGVKAPVELGAAEYDNLFVVVPAPSGAPTFLRLRY